jgi:hypothetical protein
VIKDGIKVKFEYVKVVVYFFNKKIWCFQEPGSTNTSWLVSSELCSITNCFYTYIKTCFVSKYHRYWSNIHHTLDKRFLSLELPRYIAIFPYEAQQDDELSFPADAIFEILEDAGNSGWFKARYNHQIGLIPSTYVKPIDELNPCKFTKK